MRNGSSKRLSKNNKKLALQRETEKTHYRMFKAGKFWVFSGITTFALAIGMGYSTTQAYADSSTVNSTTVTSSATSSSAATSSAANSSAGSSSAYKPVESVASASSEISSAASVSADSSSAAKA